ncbi:aldo-keto reductase AKR2E4-like [Maniola hyperantus]|uniref:aldo-keto reductase AKR2E4-like n=1 Tax=Aphantopus hyperantus TaxID=2795564 RepID=UPI0015697E22|nr:aldo-keto reductase AKR2E4-like [Maniola hyperantus]
MRRFIISLFFAAVSGHSVPACKVPSVRLNDGNLMPQFAFGTWLGFDEKEVPVPVTDDSMGKAVEMAIDAGYRHIDTASIYNDEHQVGAALSKKMAEGVVKREDLFITTKLWNDAHACDSVVPALRESLRRLNLTHVDLYLVHYPIATKTVAFKPYVDIDYLETWRGMVEAKKLGLAKSIGICNFNLAQLQRLCASNDVKPAVLQIETNLNLQNPELREYCHDHDIAVMGYTPFGSLFPGRAKPGAPPPRVDDPQLAAIAGKYNKTVPQVVLRYLYELGVTPIPKSVTSSRISENLDVLDFQLDEFERKQLSSYHNNYRTIPVTFFRDAPNYPFELP